MTYPALAVMLLGSLMLAAPAMSAEPVAVRYTEGLTRAFPVLRATTGAKLAQGEMTQVSRGDVVDSRLVFRFLDGSIYDERVVFSQSDVFTLRAYHLSQHGPSFPETLDASFDRETGAYRVRYRADDSSPEERLEGRIDLPGDVYNGLLITLLKNLPAGASQVVEIVAFTPKPRLVKMLLAPVADERIMVGDWPMTATRYAMRPQLGLFASLLVTDIPDVKCWVAGGDAPGFLRFEGPLYFMGPVWRIDPN